MSCEVGEQYAYRKQAYTLGAAVQRVVVVKYGPPRSRKLKVRFLDGEYEGYEEWVPDVRLIAPWHEAEDVLEEERCELKLLKATDRPDEISLEAVQTVFFGSPRFTAFLEAGGAIVGVFDARNALTEATLGLNLHDVLQAPGAYITRGGDYRGPFQVGLEIAQRLCHLYPDHILRYEKECRTVAYERLAWRVHDPERQQRLEKRIYDSELPALDMVREWCGITSVSDFEFTDHLREEVRRLYALIESLARWLRDSGHVVKAGLVLRDLDRSDHQGLLEDVVAPKKHVERGICPECGGKVLWVTMASGRRHAVEVDRTTIVTPDGTSVTGHEPHWRRQCRRAQPKRPQRVSPQPVPRSIPELPPLVTIPTLRAYLKLPKTTTYDWIRRGKIQTKRMRGQLVVTRDEVKRLTSERQRGH